MNKKLLIKIFLTWLLFIPVAIINGSIRNFIYRPVTGELLAHQISSLILSALYILFVYFMFRNDFKNISKKTAIFIGVIWVLLTILFEFGFGHYIMGNSWEKLLHDYNIFEGRIWVLVLLTELFAPLILISLFKPQTNQK